MSASNFVFLLVGLIGLPMLAWQAWPPLGVAVAVLFVYVFVDAWRRAQPTRRKNR